MLYHVCQSDVKKHSTSNGKDGIWSEAAAQQDAQHQAEITAHSREQVKKHSLRDTHTRVQQNHKVT